jgi:uncharacterized protein
MRVYSSAVASVVVLLLWAAPTAAADTSTQTLSVTGSGSAFVRPDVADLSVSVSRSARSSRSALSAANRSTDAVVRAIRALGVSASDIQTGGVNLSSTPKPSGPHKRRRRVWTATETLAVRVRRIKLVGRVVDAATRAGASSLDGPTYSFSDPSAGKLAATRAAIADARRRADDAAAAIGYRVTGVQSLKLDPQSQGGTAGSGSSPAAGTPLSTTVHPGTQEVDVQVEVVYTIAPA